MAARSVRLRRSDSLVCYWDAGGYILHDPLSGTRARGPDLCVALLTAFSAWRSAEDVAREFPRTLQPVVRAAISRLRKFGFLRPEHDPASSRKRPATSWLTWGHATSFFHFDTRDLPWIERDEAQAFEARVAATPAPPRGTTSDRRTRRITPLPRSAGGEGFPAVLLERRTWRDFADEPVPLAAISTLLDLSFGDQLHAITRSGGRVVLKTSPSPGATQSLEAYVIALNVESLDRGLYWYDPEHHTLQRLRGRAGPRTVGKWLAGQWWFERAGLVVFLTGALARIQRRYKYGRAYRSWLLEAGHVCQTFCLTATWLKLAPFCTQALADSSVETALGLDPMEETVLYAMGVGVRPAGRTAAPWPAEHSPDDPYQRPRNRKRS